ncbi:MAG TPA: PA2778 family cysteine peptidase [Geothermobacteraceae bacterium]|nr:PA2778 family cysteine peptidase [Geothermobacteraceae bacterium]
MSIRLSTIAAKAGHLLPDLQADSRTIAGLLCAVLLLVLSGCAFLPSGPLPQSPGTPARGMVRGVPFYPQEDLQCGPAALAMVLQWSGVDVVPADLTGEVFSPGLEGSLQSALVGSARRHARVAYPLSGSRDLLTEIAAGHPVLVLLNLGLSWYPKWHYAVVTGYDQTSGELFLHSGRIANESLSTRVFTNVWKRSANWGLLVLPPGQLPASGRELPWLTAVAGLENVGEWQAATDGYAAALERWEESFPAWMGLGVSNYHLGRLDAAAAAFDRATRIKPDNGMAFNNLAQVLAERGRRREALAAAQRAVALGGPLLETFRQTYEEIETQRSQTGRPPAR